MFIFYLIEWWLKTEYFCLLSQSMAIIKLTLLGGIVLFSLLV